MTRSVIYSNYLEEFLDPSIVLGRFETADGEVVMKVSTLEHLEEYPDLQKFLDDVARINEGEELIAPGYTRE